MSKELEKSIKWLSNVNNFKNVSRYSKEYFEHLNKVVKALTELAELKGDVKRFIELLMKDNHTGRDTLDIEILKDKLLKVGNEG